MRWNLQWGSSLEFLKGLERDQGFTPPALATLPAVTPEMNEYLAAFDTISASRGFNMAGLQSLKLTEIAAYLGLAGEGDPARKTRLTRLILTMDQTFMKYHADKAGK